MPRRPDIPAAERARIDAILDQSEAEFTKGDIRAALALNLEAWGLIPEPKSKWDYYPQTLAVGFVEDFTDLGDLAEAKRWIDTLYDVYDDPDHQNVYTLMLEGTSLYKLGEKDAAAAVFQRVFDLFGREAFKGSNSTYLDFLLKHKA